MFKTLEILGWIWVLISSLFAYLFLLEPLLESLFSPSRVESLSDVVFLVAIVVIPYCATKALRGINQNIPEPEIASKENFSEK